MDKQAHCVVVNCHELKEAEKIKLAQQIFSQAHSKIFTAPGFLEFYNTVINPPTIITKLLIYYLDEKIMGYASFQLYEMPGEQQPVYIAMSEMGLVVSAKKFAINPVEFVIKELMKLLVSQPDKQIFIVDTLISPQIYSCACNFVYQMYPRYNEPVSVAHQQLVSSAAKHFNWCVQSGKEAVVRQLNWQVNSRYLALNNVAQNNSLQFYLSNVSDYGQGKGLVVVIPVTFKNMALTLIKISYQRQVLLLRRKIKLSLARVNPLSKISQAGFA